MNVWVEEGRRGWTDDRAISLFRGVEEGPVTCDITETSLTPSAGGEPVLPCEIYCAGDVSGPAGSDE